MLAVAVALIPLGTAFTFPCVTALLSRVIAPRERGLYMGMQQTYGGVSRIIAPLFFGWAFDWIGVSSPYFFSAAFSWRRFHLASDWTVCEAETGSSAGYARRKGRSVACFPKSTAGLELQIMNSNNFISSPNRFLATGKSGGMPTFPTSRCRVRFYFLHIENCSD